MKFELCEWEENGYQDSDGYVAYWDTETETVARELVWTTRGGTGERRKQFEDPTPEVVRQAIAWLAGVIFDRLRHAEHADVLTPEDAARGDRLRLLNGVRFKDKKSGRVIPAEAGEAGVVIWVGAFGQFYRNGYNRPGRHNRRIGLKLDDGRVIFTALKNLRKDSEPMTDEELQRRAEELAQRCCFGAALSMKFAWDTTNKAAAVLAQQAAA